MDHYQSQSLHQWISNLVALKDLAKTPVMYQDVTRFGESTVVRFLTSIMEESCKRSEILQVSYKIS